MNIPEAIEILRDILRNVEPGDPPEEHEAVGLGIEALEMIQSSRDNPSVISLTLLPGETGT